MSDAARTPFKSPTNAISWIIQLAMLGLCFTLSYLIGEGSGWATGTSIAAMAILIELAWPLRREAWFWLAIAALAVLHAWAVLTLDWSWIPATPSHRPGYKALGAVFCADLAAMMGVIYGIYRFKYGKPLEAVEPSIDDLPTYGDRDTNW